MLRFLVSIVLACVCGVSTTYACCGEKHKTDGQGSECSCGSGSSCGEMKKDVSGHGCKGECGCSECKKHGCHDKGCGCKEAGCKGAAAAEGSEASCECTHGKNTAKYSECEHHAKKGEFHVAKGNACTGDVDCCCYGGECLGGSACCKTLRCKK